VPITIEPGDLGGVSPHRDESQDGVRGNQLSGGEVQGPNRFEAEFVGGFEAAKVNCAQRTTGEQEWKKELPSSAYGAATIANDVVFTTDFAGDLYAFETGTGLNSGKPNCRPARTRR
jgi:alcohol dehydrogenase (cytochrome c)